MNCCEKGSSVSAASVGNRRRCRVRDRGTPLHHERHQATSLTKVLWQELWAAYAAAKTVVRGGSELLIFVLRAAQSHELVVVICRWSQGPSAVIPESFPWAYKSAAGSMATTGER